MKKLIVFDLDGTLTESKSPLNQEMASLIERLLTISKVAIISGGSWKQFEVQLLSHIKKLEHLHNLILLPVCGTQLYQYNSDWKILYAEDLTALEKNKIIAALEQASKKSELQNQKIWGAVIEDRGSQITYSALGQFAPISEKKKWDPDFLKRKLLKQKLDTLIPEFSVRLGGTTSIDITKKGIDKAYGIKKLRDILKIPINEMIFIGDALLPDGNDYPVKTTGIATVVIKDCNETKLVIEVIIACL